MEWLGAFTLDSDRAVCQSPEGYTLAGTWDEAFHFSKLQCSHLRDGDVNGTGFIRSF